MGSSAEIPAARPRPFLNVAVLCERILTEQDGVSSLIRMVDTFTVKELPQELPPDAGVELHAFVMLKSGAARGKYQVQFVLHPPSGDPKPLGEPNPVVLEGGIHGAALRVAFTIAAKELGDYWLEVLVDREPLTRIPFRLRREERSTSRSKS